MTPVTTAVAERQLRSALERQDLTIEELIETADALLKEIAPEQTRYKVRERPDVRTIRYYVTQGILPKPFGYEGGRARYGGTHLLRLLFIKKRQTEHETLARITKELDGTTDEQLLEAMFGSATPARVKKKATGPKRLALAPGGSLEIPRAVLEDATLREQLAGNLETLAEWLRSSADNEE